MKRYTHIMILPKEITLFPAVLSVIFQAATTVDHLEDLLSQAEKVLCKLQKEADERLCTPFQVDVWIHLGRLLLRNVAEGQQQECCNVNSAGILPRYLMFVP